MSKISDSVDILKGLKLAGLASADVGQAIQDLESAEAAYSDMLHVSQCLISQLKNPHLPRTVFVRDLEHAINKVLSNA